MRSFPETLLSPGRTQHVEQLGARNVVRVQVDSLLLRAEAASPGQRRYATSLPCRTTVPSGSSAARSAGAGSTAGSRLVDRSESQRGAVGNGFVRPGDEYGDHRRPPRERRGEQGPDLLRVPGGEGDERARRKVALQELELLRVRVGRAVLAGLQPGVSAHEDEGDAGFPGRPPGAPGSRWRAGGRRCARAARGRRRRRSRPRCAQP